MKELPNSPEAEIHLLACCFNDRDVVSRCIVSGILPESFYDPKRRAFFSAILGLYLEQKPCEYIVVAQYLQNRGELDKNGGVELLIEISGRFTTTAQAAYFIETVREKATLRQIIRASELSVERCYAVVGDFPEAIAEITESITRAAASGQDNAEPTMQQVAKEFHAELLLPKEQRLAQAPGLSWGLLDVDLTCGVMMPGSLVVLAGMPSTGKSALADQTAWNAAHKLKQTTLIFTYEMTKRDKAVRIAQQQSRLNYENFDAAPREMQARFIESAKAVMDCKHLHVFERDTSVNRLVARTRAFASRGKVGLVVVDFLQYLSRLEPTIGKERTDEKLGRLTTACKQLASECGCPVMILSSLNRSAYADGKRPDMAGLKNSGEIESDADQLLIIHWPSVDPITNEEQDTKDPLRSRFYVELNQEKGRNKGVKQLGVHFDRKSTRFDNYAR